MNTGRVAGWVHRALVAEDSFFQEACAKLVIARYAAKKGWEPPVISRVEIRKPFERHGSCPDMTLMLRGGNVGGGREVLADLKGDLGHLFPLGSALHPSGMPEVSLMSKKIGRTLLLTLVFSLTACATVELTSQGKGVFYLKQFPSNEGPEAFEEIQTVSCSQGFNGRKPETNIISCRNELRNKAAQLGADIFIVEHEELGQVGAGLAGNAGCPNCISIVGTAYKRTNKRQDQPSPSPLPTPHR